MGRFKLIDRPEKFWELFEAYRKDVKDNPRIKIEYVGKEWDKVETPIERPLTIEGFKCYCAANQCDIQAYWNNRDDNYADFSPIVMRVREEIRSEQIEGGMVGAYNANLTARINSLSDKQELKHEGNVQVLSIDPLEGGE
jgi:hypothetical protein